jgi:hypothetical protein
LILGRDDWWWEWAVRVGSPAAAGVWSAVVEVAGGDLSESTTSLFGPRRVERWPGGRWSTWLRHLRPHIRRVRWGDIRARGGSYVGATAGDECGGGARLWSRRARWSRMRRISLGWVMKETTRMSDRQHGQSRESTS